jgi:hypothetical protein
MARAKSRQRRQRGSVDELPSGALRVRVYAGIDLVTKRRHYLTEIIPVRPKAEAEADRARTRLVNQVDERPNPKTNATVNQLLDRYFELFDGERTTLRSYQRHAANRIRPLIGGVKVGALDGEVFDSFYAELRRCRQHCDRQARIDHRLLTEQLATDATG